MAVKTPPNFCNERELSDYFSIPRKVVSDKAQSGEWPHYVIGGHRVFDLAEIVRIAIGLDRKEGAVDD